jgi:hypothetical protein
MTSSVLPPAAGNTLRLPAQALAFVVPAHHSSATEGSAGFWSSFEKTSEFFKNSEV